MEKRIDINRMFSFIKRQSLLNANATIIGALAIIGALFFISGLVGYFYPQSVTKLKPVYFGTLYIYGLIRTSNVFSELHNPQRGYAFLTLPVSTAEKLWGSWILSAPVFTFLFSGICIVLYFLACIIGGRMDAFHKIFDLDNLRGVGFFLIMQSVFFLGAVYFKKNNFMKTVAVFFLFWLVNVAYIRLLTWPFGMNNTHIYGNINNVDIIKFKDMMLFWVKDVGLCGLFAPFMLLVSYFRLKERQI